MGTHESRIIAASAARTTTYTGDWQQNLTHQGVHLVIDVTAVTATPSLTPKIEGRAANGGVYTILTGAAIATVSTNRLTVFPGATAAANEAANDVIPVEWRVVVTAADADSATYSVAANMLAV